VAAHPAAAAHAAAGVAAPCEGEAPAWVAAHSYGEPAPAAAVLPENAGRALEAAASPENAGRAPVAVE